MSKQFVGQNAQVLLEVRNRALELGEQLSQVEGGYALELTKIWNSNDYRRIQEKFQDYLKTTVTPMSKDIFEEIWTNPEDVKKMNPVQLSIMYSLQDDYKSKFDAAWHLATMEAVNPAAGGETSQARRAETWTRPAGSSTDDTIFENEWLQNELWKKNKEIARMKKTKIGFSLNGQMVTSESENVLKVRAFLRMNNVLSSEDALSDGDATLGPVSKKKPTMTVPVSYTHLTLPTICSV